jgi:spore coat protein H
MAELPSLPPVRMSLPVEQYSLWDNYGDRNPLFAEDRIMMIYVEMEESDLRYYMEPQNYLTKEYSGVNVTLFNGDVSKRLKSVGMRIKGGASRNFVKKSWKLSFTKFDKGRRVYQQKKLSLKSGAMSVSFVREHASRDLLYSIGSAVQRMSYAMLYINGEYRGAYIMQEEIDGQFLKSRFGKHADDGSLWKCKAGASLQYNGTSCANYPSTVYAPETKSAEKSCTPLVELMSIIADKENFASRIGTILDVEYFMRTLAAEVLTGNWDGILDGNNYMLYYDGSLFKYFRFDLDMSFGAVAGIAHIAPGFDEFLARGNPLTYGANGELGPLLHQLYSIDAYRAIYADHLRRLLKSYYSADVNSPFFQRVLGMHSAIGGAVQQDYWHSLDLTYSFDDFNDNVLHANVTRPWLTPNQTAPTNSTDFTYVFEFQQWTSVRILSAWPYISNSTRSITINEE